jgi:hypothetical protein
MEQRPTERLCKHCGQMMKRTPSEHCWVCFGIKHKSRVTPHREFDYAGGQCHCTECGEEKTTDE